MAGSIIKVISLLVLAGVLVIAGVYKLADPQAFALAIGEYELIPWWGSAMLAVYVPWLELGMAVGLLIPSWRMPSLIGLAFMLIVFCLALISVMIRGIDISCGCFGVDFLDVSAPMALLRNLVLLGVVCLLLITEFARKDRS